MDETHVYGTARPSKGSTMVGSLNFSGEQNSANAVADSSGDHVSSETDSGTARTNQLNRYGLPEPPEGGQVIEVDELLDEVPSQSASISLADTTGGTEDQSLPSNTFSKMAETLSKNQLASNQTQLHLLDRQGVMDEFMKQHATSVSSKEFAQTNKNLVTCINAMRDTVRLTKEQTSLKFKKLQAEIVEMKKMEKQLSEVERTQKEFVGAQSQSNAKLIAMHEANEGRWEKQLSDLGESLQRD